MKCIKKSSQTILHGTLASVPQLIQAYRKMRSPVTVLLYFSDPGKNRILNLINIYWHFLDSLWLYLVVFFWQTIGLTQITHQKLTARKLCFILVSVLNFPSSLQLRLQKSLEKLKSSWFQFAAKLIFQISIFYATHVLHYYFA